MNNRTIWVILAVIILAGGGYFLMKNQPALTPSSTDTTQTQTPIQETQTPTSTESAETPVKEMMVTYSDNGFSPASLTVKIGDSVTFKNESTKMMWVASNPHPTHNGLPGFDALQGVAKGQTYTYIFTKMGTWGYHNHLSSKDGGTIVVK